MPNCDTMALPSVSVRERIQAMEQRRDSSVCAKGDRLAKNEQVVSPRSGATLDLVGAEEEAEEATNSKDSVATPTSTSPTNQYTTMTRKARSLRNDRYMRRLQNKKRLANNEVIHVTKGSTQEYAEEERDPRQDEPGDEANRDVDGTSIPPGTLNGENILDDIIDSLFRGNDAANKELRRLSVGGNDEFTIDEIVISCSDESAILDCISPLAKAHSLEDDGIASVPSFPFDEEEKLATPDEDEDIDILEGRDAVETDDRIRCSTPITDMAGATNGSNSPHLSPPTPVAQNKNFAEPPVLPRRSSWGFSRYEPITPTTTDANNTTNLPLPSSTKASLSIPALEWPADTSTHNHSMSGVHPPVTERQILESILSEDGDTDAALDNSSQSSDDEGVASVQTSLLNILSRPSLGGTDDESSDCDSMRTPSSLLGQPSQGSAALNDINGSWKDAHTCVLRY